MLLVMHPARLKTLEFTPALEVMSRQVLASHTHVRDGRHFAKRTDEA